MYTGALSASTALTRAPSVGGRIDFKIDQPATPDPQPQQPNAVASLSSFDIVTSEENAALLHAFGRAEGGYRPDGRTTATPHPIGTRLDLSA